MFLIEALWFLRDFHVFMKTLRVLTFHTFHWLHHYARHGDVKNRSQNNGWAVRDVNTTDIMMKRTPGFSHK
jgi:hypothetical protein